MKKVVLILLFLFISNSIIYSQEFFRLNNLSKESIFVHYNTSLLLSGENLYYKIYCLNNNNLSSLSKMAYIELIDENKKSVFKHKIRLENGLGQGDFFIPTNIASGNYKLISYTELMKNGSIKDFFQGDIVMINPFQKIINSTKFNEKKDSLVNNEVIKENLHENDNSYNFLKINVNKKNFSRRDKVEINIESLLGENSFGNYSLSVRKIDTLKVPTKVTSSEHYQMAQIKKISNSVNGSNDLEYLPELRGELLFGKITTNNPELGLFNKNIVLTVLDESNTIKIATSDKKGNFYFNLEKHYLNPKVVVQIVDHKKEDFTINFNKKSSIKYEDLNFNNFKIIPKLKGFILKRSIHNQIENAFNSIKADSIFELKIAPPFYGNSDILEYVLDDYKRFPTLRETIIEVINHVWFSQNKGNYTLHVRGNNSVIGNHQSPLVLINGLLIQDHNMLMGFDANKIEKIQIVRNKYVYGSQIFGGIISIKTNDKNYVNYLVEDYTTELDLIPSEPKKSYFNQIYSEKNKLERIPDYRYQLYWNPNLNINSPTTNTIIFTSDISGDYEISLEGFTSQGNPVSIRKVITVI